METTLIVIGSLLAASGTVPYIIATIRGKTKPRIVTWLTWALLTGLASWAAFSDGQLSGGLFALLGALSTGCIVVFGLRYGDRQFERLDIVCLSGVAVGLALWLLSGNAAIGVWAAIIIDCIGLVPTVKHAWQAPHEETAITYAAVLVGGLLTVAPILSQGGASVTSIGYPLYAALSLGTITAIILARRRLTPLEATS